MLTDEQWSALQPIFPPPSPHLHGRPPLDDRRILEAVIYKVSSGAPWYDLPSEYPSHQTVYRRYRQWRRSGLWGVIFKTLLHDLTVRGEFDFEEANRLGYYHGNRRFDKVTLTIDPSAPHTWQIATGYFLLRELVHLTAPDLKKFRPVPRRRPKIDFASFLKWALSDSPSSPDSFA
jgi:transposase